MTTPPAPPPKGERIPWYLRFEQVVVSRSVHGVGVRFDCLTNIPSFHRTSYRGIERTYAELARYFLALACHGPRVIIPALPLPTPWMLRASSELEDLQALVRRWFAYIEQESVLCMHRETLRFVEADYSYEPLQPEDTAPPTFIKQFGHMDAQVRSLQHIWDGSVFDAEPEEAPPTRRLPRLFHANVATRRETPAALVPAPKTMPTSINVSDPDQSLSLARSDITRLEKQLADVSVASAGVSKARQNVNKALEDLVRKLPGLATLEESRPASIHGRLPRTLRSAHTHLQHITHTSNALMYTDQVTLGDAMAYFELTMRMARQTLQERMNIVAERALARRVVSNKQRDAQQLQYGRHSHPDRIDAAKEEVQEAQQQLSALDQYLDKVNHSLHESLQRHSIHTHQDLLASIQRHARTSRTMEQRIADELACLEEACRASAADAQLAAYKAAHAPRRITPAQAAAARIAGRSLPEETDEERGPEAEKDGEEPSPEAEQRDDEERGPEAGQKEEEELDPKADPRLDHETKSPEIPFEGTKSPATEPEPSLFPSLVFQRDRQRGPWARLSASDAAKTLGGT